MDPPQQVAAAGSEKPTLRPPSPAVCTKERLVTFPRKARTEEHEGQVTRTLVVVPAFTCKSCDQPTNRLLECTHAQCKFYLKRTLTKGLADHWLQVLCFPGDACVTKHEIARLLNVPHFADRVAEFTPTEPARRRELFARFPPDERAELVYLWAFNWVGVARHGAQAEASPWLPIPLDEPWYIPPTRHYRLGNISTENDPEVDAFLQEMVQAHRSAHGRHEATELARFFDLVESITKVKLELFSPEDWPTTAIRFGYRAPDGHQFRASSLSHGQHNIIYLILATLSAKKGATIVVDEPEVHLNPALVQTLLDAMERARPDCFFVFITHDYLFAERVGWRGCPAVWVESIQQNLSNQYPGRRACYGLSWRWSEVPLDGSQPSLIEVLGSYQRRVLFVEGKDDTEPYRIAYGNEWQVIPLHGCDHVIGTTKSMRRYREMYPHFPLCVGLIDRDRRSEDEIVELRVRGIETLRVTTIEGLYLVPEVLLAGAAHLWAREADVEERTQALLDAVARSLRSLYEGGKQEQRVRYIFNRAKYLRTKNRSRDPGAESVDAVRRFFEVDTERARTIVDTAEQDVDQQMGELDAELEQYGGDATQCIRALLRFYKHRPDSHDVLPVVLAAVKHCLDVSAAEWKNTIHHLMRDRERGEPLRKAWRGYAGEEHWHWHDTGTKPPTVAPPVAPDADSPDQDIARERRVKAWQSLHALIIERLEAWKRKNGDKPVRVRITVFSKQMFWNQVQEKIQKAVQEKPEATDDGKALQCFSEKKEEEHQALRRTEPEQVVAAFSKFFFNDAGIAWPVEEQVLASPEAQNDMATYLGLPAGSLDIAHRASFGKPGVVVEELLPAL